jgi:hypothetical protein
VFAPDSKTIAMRAYDDDYVTAVKLIDVVTGKEKLSIPIAEKAADAVVMAFTPDGRLMVGNVRVYPARQKWGELAIRVQVLGHGVG